MRHYFYFYYITCRAVKRFLFNKSADVFTLFRWIERFRRQTSLYVAIIVTCDDNVRGFVGRRLYTSTSLHKTPVSAQQNAATLPYTVLELRRFWHKNWNFRFLRAKTIQNLLRSFLSLKTWHFESFWISINENFNFCVKVSGPKFLSLSELILAHAGICWQFLEKLKHLIERFNT